MHTYKEGLRCIAHYCYEYRQIYGRKCFNKFYIKLFIMRYGHIQSKNLHNRNLAFIPFLQLAPYLPYDKGEICYYLLALHTAASVFYNQLESNPE